ncbi:MAG: hypothetical protein OEZ59_05610 [Deltaproteobacteria bacterium]|nr:hypothetical protein [Deltaproteobacteria bacterium]
MNGKNDKYSWSWILTAVFFGMVFFISSCGGEDLGTPPTGGDRNPSDLSAMVVTDNLPANDPDCPTGGVLITVGWDNGEGVGNTAGDGVMDLIHETYKVCNGWNSLVKVSADTTNCAYGGTRIDTGIDDGAPLGTKNNNQLETGEIENTQYACNGAPGTGTQGHASLVETTAASVANCPSGGITVTYGVDDGDPTGTANDGFLDTGEVDGTTHVCEGADSIQNLVKFQAEPEGLNCTYGGQKILSGLDNGDGAGNPNDGILHADEVDNTSYACAASGGGSAVDTAVALNRGTDNSEPWQVFTEATECPTAGGTEVLVYTETDGTTGYDGGAQDILRDSAFYCNGGGGGAGYAMLSSPTDISPGGTCAAGGIEILFGLDDGLASDGSTPAGTANDGTLNAGEADPALTKIICNGTNGSSGADGSLVAVNGTGAWQTSLTGQNEGTLCSGTTGTEIVVYLEKNATTGYQTGDTLVDASFTCNGTNGTSGSDGSLVAVNGTGAWQTSLTGQNEGTLCSGATGTEIVVYLEVNGTTGFQTGDTLVDAGHTCNGSNGTSGSDGSLVAVNGTGAWQTSLTGQNEGTLCTGAGGTEIVAYLEVNGTTGFQTGDTLVDASHACNGTNGAPGTDGFNSLIVATELPFGDASCPFGGTQIKVGKDLDRDNTLDAGEELDTRSICAIGSGMSQGESGLPADISWVSGTGMTGEPPENYVSAQGSSYYRFTTFDDGSGALDSSGPYTLNLYAIESNLSLTMYTDINFTPGNEIALDCRLIFWGTGKSCSTPGGLYGQPSTHLGEGTAYYLKVRDTRNMPNEFFMMASFGANHGTESVPVDLGTILAQRTMKSSIGSAMESEDRTANSYYKFEGNPGLYTMSVKGLTTVDDTTVFGMDINKTDQTWGTSCDTQKWEYSGQEYYCLAVLPSLSFYNVNVRNQGGGATYTMTVDVGDTATEYVIDGNSAGHVVDSQSEKLYRLNIAATGLRRMVLTGSIYNADMRLFDGHPDLPTTLQIGSCYKDQDTSCANIIDILQQGVDYYISVTNYEYYTQQFNLIIAGIDEELYNGTTSSWITYSPGRTKTYKYVAQNTLDPTILVGINWPATGAYMAGQSISIYDGTSGSLTLLGSYNCSEESAAMPDCTLSGLGLSLQSGDIVYIIVKDDDYSSMDYNYQLQLTITQ